MKKLFLTTFLVLCSVSVFALDECPVKLGTSDYLGNVSNVIADAESCYAASDLAQACALGSSGDVSIVGAAIARCEKDMPVMSKDDAKTYKALKKKCGAKYSKLEGTMYRSMNAFCSLDVTKLYFELLTPVEQL